MSNLAGTNNDATNCRYSCAKKGYIADPYVEWFATNQIKSPLINRGTFLRTKGIDCIVERFLSDYPDGSIVSLGAGFDTRFFRLNLKCKYTEFDKEDVVMSKLSKIRRHIKGLSLKNADIKPNSLKSDTLQVFVSDVLELENEIHHFVDFQNPTLVIAECLFIYLDPLKIDSLLKKLRDFGCSIVVYDPLFYDDSFSNQMIANLDV
eukprot:NODE_168_length_14557_cov_0.729008.p9 type:complete len:206 gc:universal NODE_168_length_14557_cov_0.729008:9615-10232(+)